MPALPRWTIRPVEPGPDSPHTAGQGRSAASCPRPRPAVARTAACGERIAETVANAGQRETHGSRYRRSRSHSPRARDLSRNQGRALKTGWHAAREYGMRRLPDCVGVSYWRAVLLAPTSSIEPPRTPGCGSSSAPMAASRSGSGKPMALGTQGGQAVQGHLRVGPVRRMASPGCGFVTVCR